MSLTRRALWTIDRNLGEPLTLSRVADACGVSPHHLAHAFRAVVGRPVMDYVRARRLSEAADALALGTGDILQLALESGYASHEAFTRAFKIQFGATPQQVRQGGTTEGLALVVADFGEAVAVPAVIPPRLVSAGEILAMGLTERCSFGEGATVTALWRRFAPEFGSVAHRTGEIPIGVMADFDADGGFAYSAAIEVASLADQPRGLERLRIAPAEYAVFSHEGHVSTIGQTYAAIWDSGLAQTGRAPSDAPSIERHRPTFDTLTGYGGVDIWIPLA